MSKLRVDLSRYGAGPVPLVALLPPGRRGAADGPVTLKALLAAAPARRSEPDPLGTALAVQMTDLDASDDMLAAIVRGYAVSRLKNAKTAEERSAAIEHLRELIMDGLLDGVRDVRLPSDATRRE